MQSLGDFPDVPIKGGGDADSTECLARKMTTSFDTRYGEVNFPPVCIDIEYKIDFALQTQPTFRQEKSFRFVATTDGHRYKWVQHPVHAPASYCEPYVGKK